MRRRGFTLIEITTVILVLSMIAAIVLPSVAATMKSQRMRSYLSDLERLTLEASAIARQSGEIVSLVSDGEGSFQIQREVDGEDPAPLSQVTPIPGVQVVNHRLGSDDLGSEEWSIRFYSDGTADAGGVLIEESAEQWALVVDPKSARGRVQRGELPEMATDQWEAGDYVQR